MKSNTNLKFYLILCVLCCNSCTDLESEVFSEITTENLPTDPATLQGQLSIAYTPLLNIGSHNGIWSSQAISSDEMMLPQRGNDWFSGGQWPRLHRHEQNPNDEVINNSWRNLYDGINRANMIIEDLNTLVDEDAISQAIAEPLLAELKVLRVYHYMWLLDQYGNVPIVTSFRDPELNPHTQSRPQVYAFVETELNNNVPLLSKEKEGQFYGRFNYWAGKALQSRLYLNAKIYSGEDQWEQCIAACNEVTNSGLYALENNYFANFDASNESSNENILVIPYNKDINCCFEWAWMSLHYNSDQTFELGNQPWNGYCVLEEFYNSYDDNDARKGRWGDQMIRGNFIAGPQYTSDGITPILDIEYEVDDPDGEVLVFTPEINALFPNCLRQAGVRVGKYQYEPASGSTMSNDFVILRYAEVLLNKAEAELALGNQSGLTLVNMIR